MCGFILGLYSVPQIYAVPFYFDYCSSVIEFEIKGHNASSFVFSQDYFDYSGSFVILLSFFYSGFSMTLILDIFMLSCRSLRFCSFPSFFPLFFSLG